MISRWWRNRKRQSLVAQPTPTVWHHWLGRAVPWFDRWSSQRREKLIANVKIFLAEKNWEGCGGQTLTEEIQVFIAAQAGLMLIGVDDYYFDDFETILVFPNQFQRKSGDGTFVWYEWRIGEAWPCGPIVVAWKEFLEGLEFGSNVVIHELAHHIDELHGSHPSSSRFGNRETIKQWHQIARQELAKLRRQSAAGIETLLDSYGTTNDAEFFAVSSETFFSQPYELEAQHRELYRCLTRIYHCDPVQW